MLQVISAYQDVTIHLQNILSLSLLKEIKLRSNRSSEITVGASRRYAKPPFIYRGDFIFRKYDISIYHPMLNETINFLQ